MNRAASATLAGCRIRDVVTVSRETPVARCAQLMHDEHVGSVVVVDQHDGRRMPVGMITDRDITIEVVAFGIDPQRLVAGDIMSPQPATARESDDLLEVLARMRQHGVRRLPVVGGDDALRGIVTADNLWELLAEEIDALARVIAAAQARESRTRGALAAASSPS